MRITRIEISNYRSFGPKPLVWELPDLQKPLAVIGSNNSGKSNLIAAVLHATGFRTSQPSAFSESDFHRADTDTTIHVAVDVTPPLRSANAFNAVTPMPRLDLRVTDSGGGIEVAHYCCDEQGKPVFNARAVKRGKDKEYTPDDREALTALQKSGAEQVYKWRKHIPIHYVGPDTLWRELKPGRYSLLGRLVDDLLEDFGRDENVMPDEDGIVKSHVGKARWQIYENALNYLENHVLSTPMYRRFVDAVERVLMEQLEIAEQGFELRLSPPGPDHFFKNLLFTVREDVAQPLLPITHMGTGFQALFVVAVLRALVDSDSGGRIFVIEEPESFLHEHFQEYFYQVLCGLARNNQVLYTTHSKKFVDPFEPRSILRLSKSPSGPTQGIAPHAALAVPSELDGVILSTPDDFAKYLRTLEPNLGNVVFASKVVIVEGPHDLLAYKSIISENVNLGLHNTAVVAAWGKDSLLSLIDLCALLEIQCFVIHDSDLPQELDAETYTPAQKAQRTKNERIAARTDNDCVHQNVPNLEGVLGIPANEKSASAVFAKVRGLDIRGATVQFPGLIPSSLIEFLELDVTTQGATK